MSASAIPYRRAAPGWLKREASDVCEQICKLAKKGMTPSQIGVILRDSHGIAQVRSVTGNKVLRILKGNGAWQHMLCHSHFALAVGMSPAHGGGCRLRAAALTCMLLLQGSHRTFQRTCTT